QPCVLRICGSTFSRKDGHSVMLLSVETPKRRCDSLVGDSLKMETHISGNVIILHCAGRIVFGDEAAAFRERIKNILLGTNQIVVNLEGIDYIDSGGLGTLVGVLASTRNRGGENKLVHATPRVAELLRRTRLHTVFKSYGSDEEAVAAFHSD